jgi:hypothetical protein
MFPRRLSRGVACRAHAALWSAVSRRPERHDRATVQLGPLTPIPGPRRRKKAIQPCWRFLRQSCLTFNMRRDVSQKSRLSASRNLTIGMRSR